MKKSFLRGVICIFLFSIVLGSFSFDLQNVYAQTEASDFFDDINDFNLIGLGNNIWNVATGGKPTTLPEKILDRPANQVDGADKYSKVSLKRDINEFAQEIYAMGLIGVSKLVTWFVGGAGYIFDRTINETTQYPAGLNDGITDSWKIVRDLSNILIVFSLLYLAILTIWEGQGFAQKKVLAGILLAAVAINFSFFFTKDVVFGISNYVGIQVLEQIRPADGDRSYSAGFMEIVSPQKVLSGQAASQVAWSNTWDQLIASTGKVLLLSVVVLLLGIIFLGTALTLVYRYIIFVLLIIFSPIGIVSSQIPFLKKIGSQWFEQLKKQAIYFPAFTIVLYVVLTLCYALADNIDTLDLLTQDGAFSFLFTFILVVAFMIGLLILPGMMGAAGAGFMTKAGEGLKKRAQNLKNIPRRATVGGLKLGARGVVSGTARIGRSFTGNITNPRLTGRTKKELDALNDKVTNGGRISSLIARTKLKISSTDSAHIQETARENRGSDGDKARKRLEAADKAKNRTYDFRNTKFGSKLGLGKGIVSWQTLKDQKEKEASEEIQKQNEKETKLFGLGEMHETPENKLLIEAAKEERTQQENKLKEAKKRLADAKKAGASDSYIKRVKDNIEKREKELEVAELKVGTLQNAGKVRQLELMKARQTRLINSGKWSVYQQQAADKIEKDLIKSFRLSGQSGSKKKDRAERNRDERDSEGTPPTPPPAPAP